MDYRRTVPLTLLIACGVVLWAQQASTRLPGFGKDPQLPPPDPTHQTQNYSTASRWPAGAHPTVPPGFTITRYAENLVSPRWLYILPNGDVLVAEAATEPKPAKTESDKKKQEELRKSGSLSPNANRITLLRDSNKDGKADTRAVFREGLNQPFGMLLLKGQFYIANTDGVLAFPFQDGQNKLEGPGKKILSLPAGGYNNHWTRNLIASPSGDQIFVTVGSASNVGEHGVEEEKRRANILRINPDGSGETVYASGLRNPNGMDWSPGTNQLWVAVNERDNLGENLVPDYITHVQAGGFYGWPYSYYGQHADPRVKPQRPDLVSKAIVPDFAVGPHTASLGFAFYKASAFPDRYRGGAFVGQHGSWNRRPFSGYKVIFIPFRNGNPSGPAEDFATGFLADEKTGKVYGRPVGVTVDSTGALLIADDGSNIIWRVSAGK